jgi:hypothetical protein
MVGRKVGDVVAQVKGGGRRSGVVTRRGYARSPSPHVFRCSKVSLARHLLCISSVVPFACSSSTMIAAWFEILAYRRTDPTPA